MDRAMSTLTREQVLALIRAHLADELDLDADAIAEGTRFREDLEADSLDLYTLVQELEDTYGVRMSDEQAARILTVGQAVDFVLAAWDTPMRRDDAARRRCWRNCPRSSRARCSPTRPGASGAATPMRAWRSSATACWRWR